MSQRSEELANQFEQANDAVVQAVQSMPDQQWTMKSKEEGWPVGVAAHHIVGSYEPLCGFIQAAGAGQPLPPITLDQLNQLNAQHAVEFANVTRAEVIDVANESAPAAAAIVRSLNDEQLDRLAETPFGGAMTTEQIIQNVLIGHTQGHLASIQAAS